MNLDLQIILLQFGDKKKDCKIDSLQKRWRKRDGEDHTQVVYGGAEENQIIRRL